MPITLAPYDPSRNFKCAAPFRAGGKIWSRGQEFDKTVVNGRVLEQLYEQRRLVYADGQPKMARGPKRVAQLLKGFVGSVRTHHAHTLTPVEAHEQLVAEQQIEDTEGASGTAREAPGAEESASAESGTASAPQTGEDRPDDASPTDSTVDAEAVAASPDASEAAAAPVGEAATAAATNTERDSKVEQLMIDHSQSQLLERAKGIAGINSKASKKRIAEALVDAGLAG